MKIQQDEASIGFDAAFRQKAAAAISEFENSLGHLVGEGTLAERVRLRDAADGLMRLVASVMILME